MSSNWKDSDFDSFWRFYNTAQTWTSQMEDALRASTKYFYNNGYEQIFANQEDISAVSDTTSLIRMKTEQFANEYLADVYYEPTDGSEELEETMEIEGHIMGDEKDWTPEMIEFVQKTREHRQQLAAARAKALEENKTKKDSSLNWVEKDSDEFVMAEEIGVYGAQKLSTSAPTHNQDEAKRKEHAKEFYGSAAEKIMQLENQMNLKFEQIHVEKNATLWPSIPLRF